MIAPGFTDYKAIVANAIAQGLAKPPAVVSAEQLRERERERVERLRARQRRVSQIKRAAFYALGLTAMGTPRKRTYDRLDGLTAEQKRERRRLQTLASTRRVRAERRAQLEALRESGGYTLT